MENKWLMVHTKPGFQKKVADYLSKKNVEFYLPVLRYPARHSDTTIVEQPLFKIYLFIKGDISDVLEFKKIPGIINVIYWLGRPVQISEAEVKTLRHFLEERVNVRIKYVDVLPANTEEYYSKIPITGDQPDYGILNRFTTITFQSIGYEIYGEREASPTVIESSAQYGKNFKPATIKFSISSWLAGN